MCPSFPLGRTLTRQGADETEVSLFFVLIGTRQRPPDIRTRTAPPPQPPGTEPGINILIPLLQRECRLSRFGVSVYLQVRDERVCRTQRTE